MTIRQVAHRIWHYFLAPYGIELMGLAFLAVSIGWDHPLIVNLGFSLLIYGTLRNGFRGLWIQISKWRNS